MGMDTAVQQMNNTGTADVIARPPLLFLAALLLGFVLDHLLSLPGGTGGQRNSIAQRLRRERLVRPAAEPFHKRAPDERPNTGSILIVTLLLIARAVGGDLGRRQNIGFGPARIVKVDYRASGQVHCDTPRAMGSWERPTARYLG